MYRGAEKGDCLPARTACVTAIAKRSGPGACPLFYGLAGDNTETRAVLPTAYCLLPTAYCLLPTAHCPLPTAYCLLPTALAEFPES